MEHGAIYTSHLMRRDGRRVSKQGGGAGLRALDRVWDIPAKYVTTFLSTDQKSKTDANGDWTRRPNQETLKINEARRNSAASHNNHTGLKVFLGSKVLCALF